MDEDMGGLGRPVPRPAYGPDQPLDEVVSLSKLLKLLGRQLQPRLLDEDGKALRRNWFGHDLFLQVAPTLVGNGITAAFGGPSGYRASQPKGVSEA